MKTKKLLTMFVKMNLLNQIGKTFCSKMYRQTEIGEVLLRVLFLIGELLKIWIKRTSLKILGFGLFR